MIRVRHIAKAYQEGDQRRVVFENLCADFNAGEMTAVIGRSGTGKSTLLNLLSGIDEPDSGAVYVDQQLLTGLSDRDRTLFRRSSIGFVFQFFNLIPTLTVAENLTLPLELLAVPVNNRRPRVQALLSEVGLADRMDSFPDRLSGGEQQRVAIARALVHAPAVLMADEPTGNLDRETGHEVLALLRKLCRAERKALIVVTHSEEVCGCADRTLSLTDGELVERIATPR